MFPLIVATAGGSADVPPASGPAQLITVALIAVVLIIALISWLKVHPFLALTGTAICAGIAAGMAPGKSVDSFTNGFGATMAGVGVLIAIGAIFGKLLADSGGADAIVDALLHRAGFRSLPWIMAVIGAVVGLPMFFEVGLVLLMPIILLVARRSGVHLLKVALPAIAGLSAMHGLVPPHPGPLVAISTLNANIGLSLAIGAALAVPLVVLAGPVLSFAAARWMPHVRVPEMFTGEGRGGVLQTNSNDDSSRPPAGSHGGHSVGLELQEQTQLSTAVVRKRPSALVTTIGILLPIVCMLVRAVNESLNPNATDSFSTLIHFIGTPTIALGLALIYAMIFFVRASNMRQSDVGRSASDALLSVAGILLIVGAGGGLKQILIDAGIGSLLAKAALGSGISIVLLSWLVAALVRVATGSATVATVTASGILAPLAVGLSSPELSLLVIAIGAGSLFLSHVNDPGFWMVKEFLGLTVSQTFKTWTLMVTLLSFAGLAGALLIEAFI
ncbi:GntP family permease [Arthrobacter sp. 135MFCol5.1]|uniref:GntP family permease n=1 Tax=Arthrobacter sp. 135MFCol5.1 TaxID=1158050 RepID=UPI00036BE8A8|nr:SLC13 family permease [Arthrobacter sp. 135MFCol5.1]